MDCRMTFILVTTAIFLHYISAEVVKLPKLSLDAAFNFGEWRTAGSRIFICIGSDSEKADGSYSILKLRVDQANEIHFQVDYELSKCTVPCSYSFDVHVLRSNEKYEQVPEFNEHHYLHLGKLTNHTVIKETGTEKYSATLRISTEGKKGIYFAFTTKGVCGWINEIRMWYISCPTSAGQLLNFPKRPAPNSSLSVIHIKGTCVDKSVALASDNDNFMTCYSNGTTQTSGGCQCEAGYYMNGTNQCLGCPPKTFKQFAGNGPCLQCTKNVKEGLLPRKSLCECQDGFFRPVAAAVPYQTECEAPPSQPRALNVTVIRSEWAMITWNPPENAGTGDSVLYEVNCKQCDINVHVTANLSLNLTNLKTYTPYDITVFAENNVTKALEIRNFVRTHFKTLSGLPSSVLSLKAIRNDDGSVTIKWEVPAAKGGPDLRYFIVINGKPGFFSKGSNYSITQQEKKQEYKISVKSHTSAGFSKEETIEFAIEGKAKGIPLSTVIGVCIAFGIIIVIAIILIVIFYKRRHPRHLQTVRLEDGTVKISKSGGRRVYVEPTTYQDVTDAVREFANELERNWIELDHIIGGGEFGDVYKGTLQRPLEDEMIVAVKILKGNASKKASDDFLSESVYMGQFDDPNVVGLEGVIHRDKPIMIVIEYMSNGSLETYLRENDSRFSSIQLLGMARGVSSGMTYLAELSFVHRDLAARNILVSGDMVCKVADFGMSRELSKDDAYNTTGGKIPVRWTSPEAIQYKKFTQASDVWSYGILLWEIMSYSERPYWDWGNYEVIERLASGYRLPPPMGCPKVVHDLMLSCWQKDRIKRPKFREIRNTVDKWIRNPELLKQEASVVTKRDENLDYASMTTLKEWLDSIRMGQYLDNFTTKNFVTTRQILKITEEELKDIGVQAVGHRMKIMKSIKATIDQLSDENLPLVRENSLSV